MCRLLVVLFAMAFSFESPAETAQTVLPTHIQAPNYPVIAKTAHIYGDVELQVRIGDDGRVLEVSALSGPPLLYNASQTAVSQWKFVKPTNAPLVATVICSYRLNPAVKNATNEVAVSFDLPNRVTIIATPELVQAYSSRP